MEKEIEFKAIVTKDWLSQLEVYQKNKSVYLYMNSYWVRPCEPKEDQVLMNVTLSPACPERSSPEPDYKAMWKNLRASLQQWKHDPDDHCIPNVLGEMADIEALSTPQGDQTGVKKEGT